MLSHKALKLGKTAGGEIIDLCLSIMMIMFPSKYFGNLLGDLVTRSQGCPAIYTEFYIIKTFLAISQLSARYSYTWSV